MNLKEAILATLAYHSVFDYPLTEIEIEKYLIGKKATVKSIKNQLKKLREEKIIYLAKDYYYLKNGKKLERLRLHRQKISIHKLKKAFFFANLLKNIPTIKLVAISGALAMQNSTKADDIDFFIISQKNAVWITRFLANVILFPFKRNPRSKYQKDKACLNLFIEENALKIQNQNLYTAHEIAQAKPVWGHRATYSKFIKSNSWVFTYLPNWVPNNKAKFIVKADSPLPQTIEKIAKWAQVKYMRPKMTTEKIFKSQIYLHPANTEEKVLKAYNIKLKNVLKSNV